MKQFYENLGSKTIPSFNDIFIQGEQRYMSGSSDPVEPYPHINQIARARHPRTLITVKISKIESVTSTIKSYTLLPLEGKLPTGRAGQYTSIYTTNGQTEGYHPFSITSTVNSSSWEIAIERKGTTGTYLFDNLKENDEIKITAPVGEFYYESLRDSENVIALTSNIGIAPFVSMAKAISEKSESFNLTIYCQYTEEKPFGSVLEELGNLTDGKVKVIYKKGKLEKSDIAVENETPSVFVNSSPEEYNDITEIAKTIAIDKKHLRSEAFGEITNIFDYPEYNAEKAVKEYKLTVTAYGDKYTTTALSNETLLTAIEKAGLRPLARCRSGECGWCRSHLISGDVFIPSEKDYRRVAEKNFGYIHPCTSYPLSDIEIEISLDTYNLGE